MDLEMAPWHVTAASLISIDDPYSCWHTLLTSIVNRAPLKKMRVRTMDVPYMMLEWKRRN